ncbi:hypothetical protein [Nocardiopsis valliformis]|uniref:hypothetical protein n=1 Tax=Nocardiopsis valliformis TaxID=239974 RepID=UPI00034515A0|nr:hypothetical protein [Nocardiopsis valliformis]
MPSSPRTGPPPRFADLPIRALALCAAAVFAVLAGAPAASAEPSPESVELYESAPTPAEYYADELAERPEGAAVVVDDVLAGDYDVAELEEELHRLFSSLDMPYHVIVSPFPGGQGGWDTDSVLASVADRFGRDGLYVHLRPGSAYSQEARVRGGDLPVRDMLRGLYDDPRLSYDSRIDETAQVIVERLSGADPVTDPDPGDSGDAGDEDDEPGAAAAFWEAFLDDVDPTDSVGAENLGTLTGLVAGFLLASGGFWIWWRVHEGRTGAFEVPGVLVVTLLLGGLSVAGPYAYMMSVPEGGFETRAGSDETRSEPPHVTRTDRVERLLTELGSAPLHVEPLLPMDREGLAATAEQLEQARLPVRALVVPMHRSDESAADPEVLAHALAALTDEETLYLVAVPGFDGRVEVAAASTGLGIDPYDLSRLTRGIEEATPALALEAALSGLAEVPSAPGRPDAAPPFADSYVYDPGPRSERFFGDGFFPCLLVVGPLFSGMLFGAVFLVVFSVRRVRRQGGSPRTRMSARALRKLAIAETRAMVRELERAPEGLVPSAAMRDADAALVVLRRPADALDLLGATVLAGRARAAIAGDVQRSRRPVCSANPLHGQARRQGQVLVVPGRRPLCEACTALPDGDRPRRVLEVRVDGAWVPHLKLDRVWVRTNYGSTNRVLIDGILEERDA